MLIVISPAKTLDYDTAPATDAHTTPDFLEHSQELIEQLRDLSPAQIGKLMGVSDKISGLNAARFEAWSTPFSPRNAKQAVLAFKGDVYTGLDAETLDNKGFDFAQKHLRILSGLYGLLRPLDLMQAYRLEMGTKFANKRGKDLYTFWGDIITNALNTELSAQKDNILINLASNEYFKSVKPKQLEADIITPIFKDLKTGQYKIISFYAKKARGLMTRYIIDKKVSQPAALKKFNYGGYIFNADMSDDKNWVFTRDKAE
ncbi:peroxide stress protein YaaA [Parendozoicomonas sp. Alg238-R29]|uniref:peroxide stress protein YaaA n=1 Tax=Parendozoicomonas sp. Alg238-R29 TaxID=2993446 RepID=UPI00248EBB3C|nr:peroxide stress protein YaaA [Parendozoicomonas sp. Alg238-R29]